REAGHEGPISPSLVSNLRRELGLTGDKQGGSRPADGNGVAGPPKGRKSKPKKRRRSVTPATERKPLSGRRDKAMAEIEGDIDRLIFKLMDVGGMEGIEDELRKVRWLLYRSSQA